MNRVRDREGEISFRRDRSVQKWGEMREAARHALAVLRRGDAHISVVKDSSSMKNVLIDMKHWLTTASPLRLNNPPNTCALEFGGLWMLWANVTGSFAKLRCAAAA